MQLCQRPSVTAHFSISRNRARHSTYQHPPLTLVRRTRPWCPARSLHRTRPLSPRPLLPSRSQQLPFRGLFDHIFCTGPRHCKRISFPYARHDCSGRFSYSTLTSKHAAISYCGGISLTLREPRTKECDRVYQRCQTFRCCTDSVDDAEHHDVLCRRSW